MLGLGNILTKGGAILGFPNKYSFNFDGSDNSLQLNVGNGLISKADIEANGESFSAWIKLDNVSGTKYIVCHGKTVTEDNAVYGGIYVEGATAKFRLYKNSAYQTISGTTTLSADTWYHIVGTYDGENNDDKMRIYINGSLEATSSAIGGDFLTGEPTLAHIGRNVNTGSSSKFYFFNGLIDEVAVWNTALDASTIAKLGSKPVDVTKYSASNLKLWLRAGDKVLPENDASITRQDFYTDFDGSDDCISVSPVPPTTSTGSASFWVKNSADNGEAIFSFGDASTNTFFNIAIGDGATGLVANELVCILRSIDDVHHRAGFSATGSDRNILVDGNWHHVAVTGNGSEYKIYIDGISKSINITSGDGDNGAWSNVSNIDQFFIGKHSANGSDATPFQGQISSLALYQTALDAQTISQMAKSRFIPVRDNRFSVVDFDGANDYIAVPDNDSLSFGDGSSDTPFSISVWANLPTIASTYFISKGHFGSNYEYLFHIGSDKKFYWILFDQSSGGYIGRIYNTALDAYENQWVHFCGTYSGSGTNSGIKLYINGVQVDDTNGGVGSYTAMENLGAEVRIMRHNTVYSDGEISSLAVYNTAKSAEEIYAIYQQGITYDESSLSGLVGYWRMGDDTSKAYPTIADSSSNSNDGTITNGASDDIVQQMVAGYDMGAFESTGEETKAVTVTNGDVETWSDATTLSSWLVGGSVARQSGARTSGSGSFYADFTDSGSGGDQFKTPTLSLTNGKLYRLEFYYKNNVSNSDISIYDGSAFLLSYTTLANTSNVWTLKTYEFVGGSGSTPQIRFRTGTASATISIDDLSISQITQSADLSDTFPAIIDVNEPVLGAELVTSNTTSDWTQYGSGGGEADIDNGVSLTTGSDARNAYRTVSGLTDGKLYKLSVDAYYSGSVDDCKIEIIPGSGSLYTPNLTTTSTNYVIYFVKNSGVMYILGHSFVTKTDSTSGNVLYIQNLSVKEIQGNVGTMTNQASSDLVYSSVLPDQSFLTGVNSAYNFIDLDGSNEYIDCGDGTSLDVTSNLSLSAWIKSSNTGGNQQIISRDNGSARCYILLTVSSSGIARGSFWSGNAEYKAESTTNVCDGNWHYVVATYTPSTSIKIYVDGALEATNTTSIPASLDNDDVSLNIGRKDNGSLYFNGDISQVSIYSKTLEASDISAIYTAGRHGNLLDSYSDNLVGYWAMGALDAKTGLSDVGNGTIYDRSGNSNHGTATNTESADLKSSPNAEPNGYAKGDTNRSTTTP